MLKKKHCYCFYEWILLLCHLLLPTLVCSKHHEQNCTCLSSSVCLVTSSIISSEKSRFIATISLLDCGGVQYFTCITPCLGQCTSICKGNPANDLVEIINQNRTAQKLRHLNDSPGLGCMALQYVELCKGNCSGNSAVNCKPPEDDFTEVFAPNCGVELPTIGTITGLIVGCQSKYTEPSLAFANVLVKDKKSLSVLRNRSHSEVGVGLIGFHKGPFFWCVLFSNGGTNSSFVLEDHGEGIKQKKGCYSGSAFPCNAGHRSGVLFSCIITFSYLFISLLNHI